MSQNAEISKSSKSSLQVSPSPARHGRMHRDSLILNLRRREQSLPFPVLKVEWGFLSLEAAKWWHMECTCWAMSVNQNMEWRSEVWMCWKNIPMKELRWTYPPRATLSRSFLFQWWGLKLSSLQPSLRIGFSTTVWSTFCKISNKVIPNLTQPNCAVQPAEW